jgi:hypothetical protein
MGNRCLDKADIRLCDCLEVTRSRSKSSAMRWKIWNDLFEQLRFLDQSLTHEFFEIAGGIFARFRVSKYSIISPEERPL